MVFGRWEHYSVDTAGVTRILKLVVGCGGGLWILLPLAVASVLSIFCP